MAHHHFDWTEPFLAALREMPVLAHAAKAVGIDRSTAWRRMQADEAFKEAVDEAMEAGIDRAEAEAFRRGVVGFEEPVIDKGRLAYRFERVVDPETQQETYKPVLDAAGQPVPLTVRKHSDAMLGLILKGRRKKVYAERIEQTGADGGPLMIDDSKRAARIAALMAQAQLRKAADDFSDIA